jgi:hypothetical protein
VKKNYPSGDSITMHFKSVTHPNCPEKPKTVRAETLLSGYLIENDKSVTGKRTKLSIIS